jgi:type IV secretory pathway protease TraF
MVSLDHSFCPSFCRVNDRGATLIKRADKTILERRLPDRRRAGRPLRRYVLKDHILGQGEVLLMSDYNPASWDSRYFGNLSG